MMKLIYKLNSAVLNIPKISEHENAESEMQELKRKCSIIIQKYQYTKILKENEEYCIYVTFSKTEVDEILKIMK